MPKMLMIRFSTFCDLLPVMDTLISYFKLQKEFQKYIYSTESNSSPMSSKRTKVQSNIHSCSFIR